MLMNFNLVKWRLASLKHSASASGSSTRAKRMADAIQNGFDKDLFNN
jgi:2-oxoglutarate dehydrogenase E1 component